MIQRKYNSTWHVDDDEHNQDGIEVEVTEYPYFDDNLDLAGSTDKIIDRNTGKFFAFIDFNADDVGTIRECPHCLEYDLHNKLGPKIKKKDEPIAPDDDQFMSCYSCGNTFPIYETHFESKLKDTLEVTDNPFENESIFLATETRKEQRRKGKRKGRFSYKQEHKDPDIQREIDRHGTDNVRIIQ